MKKKFLYLGMALALSVSAVNMPYAFGQAYASVIRMMEKRMMRRQMGWRMKTTRFMPGS